MSVKKLTKKESDFCSLYVKLRNPKEAAIRAGLTPLPEQRAFSLLSKKHIKKKITELEKENTADNALISAGLQRLAFGSISDAVKLILDLDGEKSPNIDDLDLFNVSEIKFTKGKGMEIKFFDRLKALERLSTIVGSSEDSDALSFYEALERSAKMQTERDCNGEY